MPDAIIERHNEQIGGDDLTVVALNYKWRRVIAELLASTAWGGFWTGTPADVDTAVYNANELIRDLYEGVTTLRLRFTGARLGHDQNTPIGAGTQRISWVDAGSIPGTFDTDGFYNPLVKTRLQIPVGQAGYYHVGFNLRGAFSSVSTWFVWMQRTPSGGGLSDILCQDLAYTQGQTAVAASQLWELDDGDLLEIYSVHPSTGTIIGSNTGVPAMFLRKIEALVLPEIP